MKKIHFFNGCDRGRNKFAYGIDIGPVTRDIKEVTCKSCLKIIDKKDLKPKCHFEEIPDFETVYGEFMCPVCGNINGHGGEGHRVSHCSCWGKGYIIHEKNS